MGAAFAGTNTNKRTGRTTWSRSCGPECIRALIEAGRAGIPVFLDSGAFSEVKFQPRRVVAEITDPMWKERFEVYRQLADALGPLANVVAPDKVGFQEESFERLERFAPELRELIESGATLLVPLQKGNLTLAEAHRMASSILGTQQWVPAIPFKNATATPEELEEYLSLVRPTRVHLLGVGPRSSVAPQIAQAVRRGSPQTQVQMDSVVLTAHTARKGGVRRITAAQDAARERLREERHMGYQEVVSPDWTDLVGSPSHWASPTALRRIGKAHGVKGADLKKLLAHPDDFFQEEREGVPFYVLAEPEIHTELAKRMHKEETFETKRGGVREGIGDLYGGPAFIRNPEQRWEGHVPGVDTLGPPGSQLGLSFGSAYEAPVPSADENPETAPPGRLTIFNMGLGRDSMTMLCLLAQGELVAEGRKLGPEDVDAVVFSDTGNEWKHTYDLLPVVEKFAKEHGIRFLNLKKPQPGTDTGRLMDDWLEAMKKERMEREEGWHEIYQTVVQPRYQELARKHDELRSERDKTVRETRKELKSLEYSTQQVNEELKKVRKRYNDQIEKEKKEAKAETARLKEEGGFAGKAERAWWAPTAPERRSKFDTIEGRAASGVYHLRPDLLTDFAWKGTIPLRGDKSCTGNHKVAPIRKVTEDLAIEKFGPWATNTAWGNQTAKAGLMKIGKGEKTHYEWKRGTDFDAILKGRAPGRLPHLNLVGIAADETSRVEKGGDAGCFTVRYTTESYPLVEMGIEKDDEQPYLDECGFGIVRKSGCWSCPFQPIGWWWALSVLHPDYFERAVKAEVESTRRDPKLHITGAQAEGRSLTLPEAVAEWRRKHPDADPQDVLDKQYGKCAVKFAAAKNPKTVESCCPECNRFVEKWLEFGIPEWLDRVQTNPARPPPGSFESWGRYYEWKLGGLDRGIEETKKLIQQIGPEKAAWPGGADAQLRTYLRKREKLLATAHDRASQKKNPLMNREGPQHFERVGHLGAPAPGEKGFKPAPEVGAAYGGRSPFQVAHVLLNNAAYTLDSPELWWAFCAERPEECPTGGEGQSLESRRQEVIELGEDLLPDFLGVPQVGGDGEPLNFEDRVEIAVAAVKLAGETDEERWGGQEIVVGESKSRKGPATKLTALNYRGKGGEAPMWAVRAMFTDWLASMVPGYKQKLRIVNLSKDEAREFIEAHHSALPYLNARGLLFAMGLMKGNRLVAVATANTPSGNLSKTARVKSGELDPANVLELTRVASDGTVKGAASKLVSRLIDIMELGKRGDPDVPALLVTYQLKEEKGTTYKALKDKGLRPVARVPGTRPSGARKGGQFRGDPALAAKEKIRWECCVEPPAFPPDWDLLDPSKRQPPPEPPKKRASRPRRVDKRQVSLFANPIGGMLLDLDGTPRRLPNRGRPPTEIQSLMFAKEHFSVKRARKWAKEHGFRAHKVHETAKLFRVRVSPPNDFHREALRTIQIDKGIQAVVGPPRR